MEALKRCEEGKYDLAIMGHSIPLPDKEALLKTINQQCGVPVISLTRRSEPDLSGVAALVDPHEPKTFLETVERILAMRKTSAAD